MQITTSVRNCEGDLERTGAMNPFVCFFFSIFLSDARFPQQKYGCASSKASFMLLYLERLSFNGNFWL